MVKQWSHLSHIISHDMDDRYDIMRCHDSLVDVILFCGIFVMDMLKVWEMHGELVSDVYGVCHLMLIVSYYH